jgi:hypothetical protein
VISGQENGDKITIALPTGEDITTQVTARLAYQALDTDNVLSDFVQVHLSTLEPIYEETDANYKISSGELFKTILMRDARNDGKRTFIFQTCIEKDGDAGWGRYFVVASEIDPEETPLKITVVPKVDK